MKEIQINKTLRLRFPGILGDSEQPIIDVYDGGGISTYKVTNPATFQILSFATEPRTATEIDEFLREHTTLNTNQRATLTAELRDAKVLVHSGTLPEIAVEWVHHGWSGALYYHLNTRNDRPKDDYSLELPASVSNLASGPRVTLPEPEPLPEVSFVNVLLSRRTCRQFDEEPISRQSLSTLLFHTFEPTRQVRSGEIDIEKTTKYERSAVAGLSPYLVVNRGINLNTGVYRYCPDDHALFEVEETTFNNSIEADAAIQRLVTGQPYADGSSMSLVLTLRIGHIQKYEDNRAPRDLFTTASMAGHRLLLTALGVGFEVFQTAAISESVANELLGVDEFTHMPGYIVTVGKGEIDA